MNHLQTTAKEAVAIHMDRKDEFFTLETKIILPRSRDSVFPFFADAANLEILTPSMKVCREAADPGMPGSAAAAEAS